MSCITMSESGETEPLAAQTVTLDKDEHAQFHGPYWGELRIDQLSKGPFHARIDHGAVGEMMFYRECWNHRLLVRGVGPRDYLIIGVEHRRDFLWNGFSLNPRKLVLLSTADEVEFASGDSADHIVLLVPPTLLRKHVGEARAEELLRTRSHLTLPDPASRELARSVGRLLSRVQAGSLTPDNTREAEEAEFELLACLTHSSGAETDKSFREARAKRRKVLLRAVECAQQLKRPKAVPEFARELGVSQGTLESVIKEALDITPARFLRWSRLNGLKTQLRHAEPEYLRVTEACHQWGFAELGRTAVEYRQLFGESPSETLAGNAQRSAVQPDVGA